MFERGRDDQVMLHAEITALTTRTKLRVFGSNVKAVLFYGSETWSMTKELKRKLQVFINKSLRSFLRIFWPRRICNDHEELWKQLKRAAAERGGHKTTIVGLDWPHTEETRWNEVAFLRPYGMRRHLYYHGDRNFDIKQVKKLTH